MSAQLLTNMRLASQAGIEPYAVQDGHVVVIEDGMIEWVGPAADLPAEWKAAAPVDLGGRLLTPALIDCHTHIVHGGDRSREFELRLSGASYEEIARAGGGILNSVIATRAASEGDLVASALPRLDTLISEGVGTVEVKSGYGLTVADELKMLSAARLLGKERPVRIVTSYLAAHAVPPEYKGRAAEYIDKVVLAGMDVARHEGLADAVDGFCEGIAFSPDEIAKIFGHARRLGLPVRLHAEQLSNLGGAKLAAQNQALSADHLEYLDDAGARAMGAQGTVGVLLPGAYYFLREPQAPPVELLRRHGVRMAVATDCNPGTSPMCSLLMAMNMAATLFRLTPAEVLAGVTRHAAAAIGRSAELGSIAPGKRAEFAVWDAERPVELIYRLGLNPLHRRIIGEA